MTGGLSTAVPLLFPGYADTSACGELSRGSSAPAAPAVVLLKEDAPPSSLSPDRWRALLRPEGPKSWLLDLVTQGVPFSRHTDMKEASIRGARGLAGQAPPSEGGSSQSSPGL